MNNVAMILNIGTFSGVMVHGVAWRHCDGDIPPKDFELYVSWKTVFRHRLLWSRLADCILWYAVIATPGVDM